MTPGAVNEREARTFKPVPGMGGLIGLVVFVVLTAVFGWGLIYSLEEASAMIKYMLMLPFSIFVLLGLYVVLSSFLISYRVDDMGITLQWGFVKKFIPWMSVRGIEKIKGIPKVWSVFGASWPGYTAGLFNISGLGVMAIFGSELEENLVVIRSNHGVYGVTPADLNLFLELIQKRSRVLAQQVDLDEISEAVLQPVPSEDNIYLALAGLNFVCVLAYIVYMAAFFPRAVKEALFQGVAPPPRELVLLAVIAIAAFIINISTSRKLYQNMPSGGYIIWRIGIFITLFFASLSIYIISF